MHVPDSVMPTNSKSNIILLIQKVIIIFQNLNISQGDVMNISWLQISPLKKEYITIPTDNYILCFIPRWIINGI